jgi:hypothetical protein
VSPARWRFVARAIGGGVIGLAIESPALDAHRGKMTIEPAKMSIHPATQERS